MPDTKNRKFKQKFTLIELLVVIAIIAILAGILLPAMNIARERARSTACLGNLKQIGVAVQFYQQDFDSYFPPYRLNSMSWVDYFVTEKIFSDYKLFACASNLKGAIPDQQAANKGEYSHYGINYYHVGTSLRYEGNRADISAKQNKIRNTSNVVLVVENNVTDTRSSYIVADKYPDTETADIGVAAPRHNLTGFNLSWTDGHCSGMKAKSSQEIYSNKVLGQYGDVPPSKWERQ